MKLVIDDWIDLELKDYLLSQDGIESVDIISKYYVNEINIEYNEKITPSIVMKYIELFQNDKYPILVSFDKNENEDYKTLKYTVKDMCCEYCYMGLVYDLFDNKYIKSVKSDFDFASPAFDVEFTIEYDKNYNEEELIKFLDEKK